MQEAFIDYILCARLYFCGSYSLVRNQGVLELAPMGSREPLAKFSEI